MCSRHKLCGACMARLHKEGLPLHVLSASLLAQHLADVVELHRHEAPHLLIWISYQSCQSLMYMCGIPAEKFNKILLLTLSSRSLQRPLVIIHNQMQNGRIAHTMNTREAHLPARCDPSHEAEVIETWGMMSAPK